MRSSHRPVRAEVKNIAELNRKSLALGGHIDRRGITEVYRKNARDIGTDVLVVKTISAGPWEVTRSGKRIGTPFFAGKHQLQFYAPVYGSLMLVRIEDEGGRLILNGYSDGSVPEIGMHYPKGTTPELLDVLQSGSDPQRLALLAWVGGAMARM